MKRILFIISLFLVAAYGVNAHVQPALYQQADKEAMNAWVDSLFASMDEDERIGQLFMIIADVKTTNQNVQKLVRYIKEIKIGGILFHKGNPEDQAWLTNRMQEETKVPLFLSLDGDWGLSMRLSGTTRFPKNMMLGAIEDNRLIEAYGEEVGRQCREMGIHINFAPDMDVNSNEENPVIGLRSFGEDPDAVAEKGEYLLRMRLYEAQARLAGRRFVRISHSELVNLDWAESFDTGLSGTICVRLKSGTASYVSRRYVPAIKQILGI